MIYCKGICKKYEPGSKTSIYRENGSFCRNCEYYFKRPFKRCPCCNVQTRKSARTTKRRQLCRI